MRFTQKRINAEQFAEELRAAGVVERWVIVSPIAEVFGEMPPDIADSLQVEVDGGYVEPIGELRERIRAVWEAHVPNDPPTVAPPNIGALIQALAESPSIDATTKQRLARALRGEV